MDYQQLAADYAVHRSVQPAVFQALLSGGGIGADSRVLEIGCGTGNYVIAMARLAGCGATGIDPAPAMLATARERVTEITWLEGRAESLPTADESFDLAYNVDVIHHVIDRPAAFREGLRVLAPGGLFVTATDSHEDIVRRRPLSSHFPETMEAEFRRYPEIETLAQEMRAAGFINVRVEQVEHPYPLSNIDPYRAKAYSSLHLITDEAFTRGIARLEADLRSGPIAALSLYTLVWGRRPTEPRPS